MGEDLHAGPCAAGRARHEWGQEIRNDTGGKPSRYSPVYYIPCLHCPRLRVREYTMRGNHIRGYLTRTETGATESQQSMARKREIEREAREETERVAKNSSYAMLQLSERRWMVIRRAAIVGIGHDATDFLHYVPCSEKMRHREACNALAAFQKVERE